MRQDFSSDYPINKWQPLAVHVYGHLYRYPYSNGPKKTLNMKTTARNYYQPGDGGGQSIGAKDKEVHVVLDLEAGVHSFSSTLFSDRGVKLGGAFYCYIRRIDN